MKRLLSIAPVLGAVVILSLTAGACSSPDPIDTTASGPAGDLPLMPDWDAERSERLAFSGERFRTPEGFRVEEVAGDVGRGGGPDLSTVVSHFSRREILESIVYPSRVISDQYTALRIELRDGRSYTGMHAAESEEHLTLITAVGERVVLDKHEIASRELARVSLMLEGLLEAMSFDDLMSLMRYLEEGAD